MYIHLKVFVKQNKSEVIKIGDNRFKVYVKSKAERGLANEEALNALANFLSLSRKQLRIINGINTPSKLISIVLN